MTMIPPYSRFRDIPQFTSWGGYAVDVSWVGLDRHLGHMGEGLSLQLDPDFQRGHVWTEAQQIAYVEFILRGGRSSRAILWNCPSWPECTEGAPLVLVDGKQRLEAARKFMRSELPAFGRLYSEYEDELCWASGPSFKFHVNGLKTRREVLQWYLDLNTGGTVHTEDEITKVRSMLEGEGK